MNSKWTLLVVLAVAVMIPAIAVADVMVSGQILIQGLQTSDTFIINHGTNYQSANGSGLFGWIPEKQSPQETLGTVWLGMMSNETITEVNVLEINFTSGVAKNSIFQIDVRNGDFAKNTFMIVSTSPLTILPDGNILGSNMLEFSLYSGNSVVKGFPIGITEGSFIVSSWTHLYVGFFIPPQDGNSFQNGLVNPPELLPPPPPPPTPPSPPNPVPPPMPPNSQIYPISASFIVQFGLTEN
ncbi:hypothetical protein OXIME_000666 [Oxyplasma meridianum]|uniref:DUF1102 domain-containing protein n=1 Tax=Oxyplasma meridianum TaxID=3073602 RepID=A0AAX4NH83_9ARCH